MSDRDWQFLFFLLALLCFAVSAVIPVPRVNLVAVGLALMAAAFLVGLP